ncbi:hypothetical protein [Helicobacter pylori]|uniref:hypothetical protein n=1 Tax=Helicobacter pylori TaxID=210 RepID=UPI0034665D50
MQKTINAPTPIYWIVKKVVSILIRYHLSLMLISRNIREARSQLPLFKISVNSNQPLSAQLNEYDKKKSALRAVLNTR